MINIKQSFTKEMMLCIDIIIATPVRSEIYGRNSRSESFIKTRYKDIAFVIVLSLFFFFLAEYDTRRRIILSYMFKKSHRAPMIFYNCTLIAIRNEKKLPYLENVSVRPLAYAYPDITHLFIILLYELRRIYIYIYMRVKRKKRVLRLK